MSKGAICSSCIIMGPVCYTYNDLMPNNFDCHLLGRAYLQKHCHIGRCLGQKSPTTFPGTAAFSPLSEITPLLRLALYWLNPVNPCCVCVSVCVCCCCSCFAFVFVFSCHKSVIFLMSLYLSSSK